ncbi:GNAT family N-acetyltransferase [Pseudonocardia sp.]|uniref:GNAT family N-acetyltransferase n=1 Tax=Pseudonocardia sp. TaxID=60912 RepID=UPI003D107F4C
MTVVDQPTVVRDALAAMAGRAVAWAMAAGGRTGCLPGVVLADAGSPCVFLNAALFDVPPEPAGAAAAAGFFPDGRPLLVVSPGPTADLTPAGLVLMGRPPFMVRPAGGAAPVPAPPGVTVEEVVDAEVLGEWDRVLAAGYPVPHSPAPAGLLGGATRFWLARVEGEPAAVALSHTGHGLVDVEAVATLPRFRGRGVGSAVTRAATLADPSSPAVLIASDAGAGVYRRMGYVPVTRWTLWMRP